jgi:ABC-type antimicrobial peptide transport system permease subunit
LDDVIQDLLLSPWSCNRKVRFFLDLPDLGNDACPLLKQGHDLSIGLVYLLSAGRKASFGIWGLLALATDRAAEQE